VIDLWKVSLVTIVLTGCGSGGGNPIQSSSGLSMLSDLIGTTWSSSKCELALGFGFTTHTINFTESHIVFEYSYYDNLECENLQEVFFVEARPYSVGEVVTTQSGVRATKITLTRNSIPQFSTDFEFTYDETDYLYISNNQLYLASKDLPGNCRTLEEVDTGSIQIRNFACTEWEPALDFEQVYQQI
jgi:hypothetical protein